MKLVIVDDIDIEMMSNDENVYFRLVDFVIAKIIYRLYSDKSCYFKKKVSKYVAETLGFTNLKEEEKLPKIDEDTMIMVIRHIFDDSKMPSKNLIFEHRDRGIIQFWLATKHGW